MLDSEYKRIDGHMRTVPARCEHCTNDGKVWRTDEFLCDDCAHVVDVQAEFDGGLVDPLRPPLEKGIHEGGPLRPDQYIDDDGRVRYV